MTRTHRSLHRVLWPLLTVLIAVGITLALVKRAPPPPPAPPPASGAQR